MSLSCMLRRLSGRRNLMPWRGSSCRMQLPVRRTRLVPTFLQRHWNNGLLHCFQRDFSAVLTRLLLRPLQFLQDHPIAIPVHPPAAQIAIAIQVGLTAAVLWVSSHPANSIREERGSLTSPSRSYSMNGVPGRSPGTRSMVQHSTCLLYTSPSPRDRTRSRMPSSA